jgi:hypothetical protein
MNNPIKILTAAMLVAGLSIAPATAASWTPQPAQVQNAQFSIEFGNGNDYRRDNHRRGDDRFERRGNYYYFNGHRGSRERHSGWRQYNGFWFPQSAFSFSINIDGDRDRDRDRGSMRLSRAHVEWCEDHYRSYRASDNSFQPYNGPRRECVSPYFG